MEININDIKVKTLNTLPAKLKSLTIKAERPSKQVHFRVLDHNDNPMPVYLLKLESDGSFYLVATNFAENLSEDVQLYDLYLCYTSNETFQFWPVLHISGDTKPNPWHVSAHRAADIARTKWVRLISARESSAYKCYEAQNADCFPELPTDFVVEELIRLAFKDHFIQDEQHEIVKSLRGQSL